MRLEETLPSNTEHEVSVLEKQNSCEYMPTEQTINRQKSAQHGTKTLQSIDDFDASEEEPIEWGVDLIENENKRSQEEPSRDGSLGQNYTKCASTTHVFNISETADVKQGTQRH